MNEEVPLEAKQVVALDQPRRILFGLGSSKNLVEEIKRLSDSPKVFLVTDSNFSKLSSFHEIMDHLDSTTVHVYNKIAGEPTIKLAEDVTVECRRGDYNIVVGIGGGSTLDLTKLSSVLYTNEGEVVDYLNFDKSIIRNKPLPKILIPTTAGSGSEVSSFAVVIGEDRVKTFLQNPLVIADTAIIDPILTISCPSKQTAASGADVLGTAIEAVLSKKASELSDMYALEAIKLVITNLEEAVKNGERNLAARYYMSLAALFAGLAVSTPAGANISHCIAEIVGPRYRIPHGMAVGVTTPHSMRFNGPSCKEGMIKIARVMNIDEHKKDHIDNLDDSAIGPIERLLQSIGIPNSFQNSVPFEDIDDIARFIIEKQQYSYHLPEINPRPLSFENVRELLMEMCQ
jgi:alcohol dehydrogenase class IV